jgi:NAD(P)-dependent dehydrogenase (short-subunit alcohol dehydrogenase family)
VFPDQCGYAATKGGLLALTRAMALELAPQGIRVAAIGPGVIDTGLTGPFKEETERRIPLGRLGLPEDIGDTAVFLLSERARYVTGAIFYVDGGYLLQ